MPIIYAIGDLEFEQTEALGLKSWLNTAIKHEGKVMGDIVIIWCSDDYLLQYNKKFLNHDYYTDIITFDYCADNIVSGDLMISLDRVKSNAIELYGTEEMFHVELTRVISHGVLHLCGYGDKTEEEQKIMRAKEDEWLQISSFTKYGDEALMNGSDDFLINLEL